MKARRGGIQGGCPCLLLFTFLLELFCLEKVLSKDLKKRSLNPRNFFFHVWLSTWCDLVNQNIHCLSLALNWTALWVTDLCGVGAQRTQTCCLSPPLACPGCLVLLPITEPYLGWGCLVRAGAASQSLWGIYGSLSDRLIHHSWFNQHKVLFFGFDFMFLNNSWYEEAFKFPLG